MICCVHIIMWDVDLKTWPVIHVTPQRCCFHLKNSEMLISHQHVRLRCWFLFKYCETLISCQYISSKMLRMCDRRGVDFTSKTVKCWFQENAWLQRCWFSLKRVKYGFHENAWLQRCWFHFKNELLISKECVTADFTSETVKCWSHENVW